MPKVPKPSHTFVPWPRERFGAIDFITEARRQNTVFVFGEVDVTVPLQLIKEHEERTGEKLSFTAYTIRCVAKAVDEQKEIAGYRKANKGLIIFDDVDIGTLIERDFNGRKHPTMHFLMSANSKSFREIHDELLKARNADIDAVNLTETKRTNFLRLPRFVRKLMLRAMRRDPFIKKFAMGTVGVTAVGMLGAKNHRGWPLPVSPWTLTVAIGAFFRAPAVVDGDRIEPRDFLPATLCFDHDVVDGGPAARYTHRLCELIESGFELPEGPTEVVSSVKDNATPALAAANH